MTKVVIRMPNAVKIRNGGNGRWHDKGVCILRICSETIFFCDGCQCIYISHMHKPPPPHMHTQTYAHVCVLMILNASASIPFACAYCQAKNCDDEMACSKLPKWKINTYYSTMRRLDTFCSYKKNIVLFPFKSRIP